MWRSSGEPDYQRSNEEPNCLAQEDTQVKLRRVTGFSSNDSADDNYQQPAQMDWVADQSSPCSSSNNESIGAALREELDTGAGKSYFGGLLKMTHTRYLAFMLMWEVLQVFNTVLRSLLIIYSRD